MLMAALSSCGLRDSYATPTEPPATDPATGSVTDAPTGPAATESESSAVDPAEMFRGEFVSFADGSATFRTDAGERTLPLDDPAFVLRNRLIVGAAFDVNVFDGVVVDVAAVGSEQSEYDPPVKGEPGKRTLGNFIKTLLSPVGRTLYVYGGGWNWQDDGSSNEARNPALSPTWANYFDAADAGYEYEGKYFPVDGVNVYHYAGLDCSGFLGWAVYSTLNRIAGGEGFVTASGKFAGSLAERGFGAATFDAGLCYPGDIISIDGHVFAVIGQCGDGSVVIVHSTVTESRTGSRGGGVQLSAVGFTKDCQAYAIADRYMTKYYPEWHARYETELKSPEIYFPEGAVRFSWAGDALPDEEDPGFDGSMTPDKVLAWAYGEKD